MAAANTDNFLKVYQNFSTTIGAGGVTSGTATTIPLTSTTNLPTDTAIALTINRIDSSGNPTNNAETVIGVVSGTNLTNCVRSVEGTGQGWGSGVVVEMIWTAAQVNRFISAILTEHNQDGTHAVITGPQQSSTPSNPASGKDKLYFKTDDRLYKLSSAGTEKQVVSQTFPSSFANFVQSGLTIPTSATLSATSVAGTIYYNGVEISVASDGGHTYTASNDCYVDVSNAGAYTYNTVANGAAAPALTANSIRIAKVVTSGTAVTGVTQSGLDSLNNLIYPSKPGINMEIPTSTPTAGQVLTAVNGSVAEWQSSILSNIYQNGIINGGCLVAQRSAPTLSTSYQYTQVDRLSMAITTGTVSAGTGAQTTSSSAGTSGYALRASGLTTGTGGVLSVRYRMEAKDAVKFKNQSASFSCKVYQATGGAINYTITINKANSADNFSAVTQVVTSGNISVPTATATTIKFENQSLGDVSNGLEIIVTAAIGAVTTQNFDFTEFQFNVGTTAGTYYPRSYEDELASCQRYCYAFTSTDTNSTIGVGTCGSTTLGLIYLPFKITMRANPSIESVTAANWRLADGANTYTSSAIALTASAGHSDTVLLSVTSTGLTQYRPIQMQSTGSGYSIIFGSEL